MSDLITRAKKLVEDAIDEATKEGSTATLRDKIALAKMATDLVLKEEKLNQGKGKGRKFRNP